MSKDFNIRNFLPDQHMQPSIAPIIKPNSKRINSFIFWGLVIYLITLIFEGPLRFILSVYGLGTLIYLRDLLSLITITLGVYLAVADRQDIYDPLIIAAYTLIFIALFGLLVNDVSFFSTLFGLKILAVFLLGMASAEAISLHLKIFNKIVLFFFVASVVGTFTNYLYGKLPWEGLSYETSFGVVSTTKEWWTEGERRLPGFARASYDSAMVIGLTAAYLISRTTTLKALVIGFIALCGIYLTTTKGMLLAITLVFSWRILVSKKFQIPLGTAICTALLILMIALPTMACTLEFKQQLMNEVPSVLSSFAERIVSMWPKSCNILNTPYSWFLGAGIGSIGVPQMYSSNFDYSAADNLFVYLYVNGGMIFTAGLIATVIRGLRKTNSVTLDAWSIRGLMIAMLTYGVTTNMQEQPFFAILAGILTFEIWNTPLTKRSKSQF